MQMWFYFFNNIINWDVNEQYGKMSAHCVIFQHSYDAPFQFPRKENNFILIFHSRLSHHSLLFAVFHPEALNCELNKLLLLVENWRSCDERRAENERKQSQIWWVETFMKIKRIADDNFVRFCWNIFSTHYKNVILLRRVTLNVKKVESLNSGAVKVVN